MLKKIETTDCFSIFVPSTDTIYMELFKITHFIFAKKALRINNRKSWEHQI